MAGGWCRSKGEGKQEGNCDCAQRRGMILTLMMKQAPCGVWMCVRTP